MLRSLLFISFLISALPLEAQWTKLAQMSTPIGSGFFFSKDTGFIGSGVFKTSNTPPASILAIWKTTDGGITWLNATVPFETGRITSIFMKDAMTGYASVYCRFQSLWKTTDGGLTWFDITGSELGVSVCVYATSKALIKTGWAGVGGILSTGGFSTNDGTSFDDVFFDQFGENAVNGIDFVDDLNGVVMPGPGSGVTCYITSNGGTSWESGGTLDESWGVYGLKGTRMFFALPECNANVPHDSVFISTDAGRSWQVQHDFTDGSEFTGHIAGASSALYLQSTKNGLYRSDDLGLTWKNVGGPSNKRDTRFCVTGCAGQVVYAFDSTGGVYKTDDGGDSTLFETSGPAALAVKPDSLSFAAKDCQPAKQYVSLLTSQCSKLTIDSLTIANGAASFSIDTSGVTNIGTLPVSIPILFQDTSSIARQGYIHLVGHNGTQIIDTLIPLYGINTTDTKLFIEPDSAFIWTFYCQPKTESIKLSSLPCTELSLDTMYIETGAGEFTLEGSNITKVNANPVDVPIGFQFGREAVRYGSLRIKCSRNGTVIDTLIPLIGKNATAPEPFVGSVKSVIAGDTTVIPVYLKTTQDTFSISQYTLHLSYNKDLLAPIGFDIQNTLSTPIINANITEDVAGLTFTCQLRNTVTNSASFAQPLIKFLMQTYLSGVTTTAIFLDTFSISSGAPLPLCSIPQETYITGLACGDSILSAFMYSGAMPKFTSVRPNPATQGELEVTIEMPEKIKASVSIVDANGKTIFSPLREKMFTKGNTTERIDIHSLSAGIYTLRLQTEGKMAITEKFVVAK